MGDGRKMWMLAGFVVAMFAGDRLLSTLKLPRVYGSSNQARWKADLYDSLETAPDVVFIGCSYELHGISTRVIDALVTAQLGRQVTTVNLSATANSALTEFITARIILDKKHSPVVVYLGISRPTLNADDPDWLTNGLRALGDARDVPLAWAGGGGLLRESVLRATFASYHQWRDCRTIAERVLNATPLRPRAYATEDWQGWAQWRGVILRDDPSYIQQMTEILSYEPTRFEPGNPNDLAMRRAIDMLREAGVTVRLIEMPLSSLIPRITRPEVADAYGDCVDRLLADTGATLIRAPDGIVRDEDFFDAVHLTPLGAKKFSRWLADDVVEALRTADLHAD